MSGPKGIDFYYGDGTPSIAGQTFDVIKASEGAGFPPDGPIPQWYASEQAKIRASGAIFGAYLFWHPSVDNAAQVDNFKKRANFQPGDIGQLDCEVTDGLDWATVNARKNDMLARLRAEFPHNRWLLYTYLDFFSHLDGNVGDGLWIADPNAPAGAPRVQHWVIHQYASSGVDYDIANFPDAAALRAWANSLIPATAPIPEDYMIIQVNADKAAGYSGAIYLLNGGQLLPFGSVDDVMTVKNAYNLPIVVLSYTTYANWVAAEGHTPVNVTLDSSQLAAALAADLPAALDNAQLLADQGKAYAHAEAVEDHNDTPGA